MSSRSSHVRTKIVALLVSLAALWGFAAFVTIREGLDLLAVSTLDTGIAKPAESLLPALQDERRLTAVYLGSLSAADRAAMVDQRARTDTAIADFRRLAGSSSVRFAASDALLARISDTFKDFDALASTQRANIDAGRLDRVDATAVFTGIVDSMFRIYDSMATLDDPGIARDARTLISLTRGRELLSQEDALIAGALAAGGITPAEQQRFVELVGAQRFVYSEAATVLPPADQDRYQALLRSSTYVRFRQLEDAIVARGVGGGQSQAPMSTAAEWGAATAPVLVQLKALYVDGGDDVVARATPVAVGVVVRLALAGGLGLIAVIASIIMSITTARNLVRQLERLRGAALELATYRLPRVVERLQHGEKVDVAAEAPPLDFGRDEIGQVSQAFNRVQETAIRVAVEQAELRRSVRDVFLSLARRSQALLHRQLGLLDTMERRATDSEELAELFRVDHLATRMRRNAENLIVLSGATAGRAWRKSVPMVDVLRGALAEVEDYTRVTVLPVGNASLLGRAVGDVIHLLAELIENAVTFSPPQTVVRVGGSVVGNGFAIEIEDRGLGLTEEEREVANQQLAEPPEFKLTSTARLGLYVVGQLAMRHGIKVRLAESPYGGTTAIVLLPATVMADDGAEDDDEERTEALVVRSGRHRQENAATRALTTAPHQGAGQLPGSLNQSWPAGDRRAGRDDEQRPQDPWRTYVAAPPTVPGNGNGSGADSSAANGNGDGNGNGHAVLPSAANELSSAATSSPEQPTAAPRRDEPTLLTPSGLPWRQREPGTVPPGSPHPSPVPAAQLSPPPPPPAAAPNVVVPTQSRSLENGVGTGGAANGGNGRPPEEVRSIMSSYRSGTLRGRTDAARLVGLPDATAEQNAGEDTPGHNEGG